MTRLILAAGVAALAITAPAASQPGDRSGKDRKEQAQQKRGEAKAQRNERRQQRVERRDSAREQRAQRTEQRAQRVERRAQRAERPQRAERIERRAQRAERPERAQRVERARQQQAQRANSIREQRAQQLERVRDRTQQRAERVEQVREQRMQRVDRVRDQRVERQQRLAAERLNARERQIERLANRDARPLARLDQRRERQIERIRDRDDRRLARLAETRVVPLREWNDLARGGVWLNGCPPGLAKKPVPCVPPGQVKNLVGQPVRVLGDRIALEPLPNRLRFVYRDDDRFYYRYGNGYVYRVNRRNDLVSALLPLFGLGLTVGQPFPAAYSNYYLPTGLQPFYASTPFTSYRYANGYVYQIDPLTGLIADVDPLLGYGYGYGQMMPLTYSAYNVPWQYRPLFYDTSDYYYRYAPGAIYQVDPTTSLITAVAALLTGGMTVGQPLPLGYNAYNVPFGYRTTYYDTPNAWYRYSNGYIYRVDPRTQLVTALVAAALT